MTDNNESRDDRPRFDPLTGEPIVYNDEMQFNNQETAQVYEQTDKQIDEQSDNQTMAQDNSYEDDGQYRYSASDIVNDATTWQTAGNPNPFDAKAAKKAAKAAKKAAHTAKKANEGTGKRIVKRVAASIMCGVIAGAAMYGVLYTGNHYFPITSTQQKASQIQNVSTNIATTTSGSNIISENSDTTSSSGLMDVKSVVKAAMPAVVAISGTIQTTSSYGSMYPFYGGNSESTTSGTGIIIGKNDTELLMVTNAHVVDGVSNLTVTFIDNEQVSATIKGSKSEKDIAVVAVNIADIKESTIGKIAIAELGDSSEVEVGDQVVAIGNALGEGQSATVGWISALNRTISVSSTTYENLIMTDAAINPGNSGGALLNSKGQVIGINSAKYADEDVEGMGYAIPISSVTDLINTLMNKETRTAVDSSKASYLGISGSDITTAMSSTYGYPVGILVRQVESDSAASQAGLSVYDIITGFDDETIKTFDDLKSIMKYYAAGEKVTIEYYHLENGQYILKSVEVTLGLSPSAK